ncbi:MAG: Spy/CpxP family protein refolding chaperone [Syntrophales bacterium]
MKRMQKGKTLLILAVVAVLGIGSYAYADWGRGYGRNAGEYGRGSGYGPGMMGNIEEGCGNRGNFSDEDAAKMEKERDAFLSATEKTRQELYAKGLELRAEFARENPDAEKAARLQKEISELEGQFEQKRIEHMLAVRKAIPNAGRGFAGRGMMNYDFDDAPCGR